jgi:hypothetical protein
MAPWVARRIAFVEVRRKLIEWIERGARMAGAAGLIGFKTIALSHDGEVNALHC